jgi:hypothetical protein
VHQAHFIFNQPQRTQQERTFTPNGTPVISPVATRASVAPSAVERLLIRPFCAEYVYDHRWWNFSGFCLKAVCSPKSRRAAAAAAPRHRAQWALRFQGAVIFQQCLRAGLRGHRFSSYRAGRSAHWLKVKKPGIAGGAAARLINIGSCRSCHGSNFRSPSFFAARQARREHEKGLLRLGTSAASHVLLATSSGVGLLATFASRPRRFLRKLAGAFVFGAPCEDPVYASLFGRPSRRANCIG